MEGFLESFIKRSELLKRFYGADSLLNSQNSNLVLMEIRKISNLTFQLQIDLWTIW
jgi:hypothetical protein